MSSEKFALQVTPELMLKLSRDRSQGNSRPAKPALSKRRSVIEAKEADRSVGGWPPVAPAFPGFLPSLPGTVAGLTVPPKQNQEHETEVAEIRKLLDESEKVGDALHKQEINELEKVKKLAQELQEKQYRAPSKPVPCFEEREACVRCYSENLKAPLQCAKSVKDFVECSRKAQQGFVTATS